ncbi:hypothetical protein B0178_11365, partial [Streptococcus pseudopneumoniae]
GSIISIGDLPTTNIIEPFFGEPVFLFDESTKQPRLRSCFSLCFLLRLKLNENQTRRLGKCIT